MKWSQLKGLCDLIAEMEENIQNLGISIKSLSVAVKASKKSFQLFYSSLGSISKGVSATRSNNAPRYENLCEFSSTIASSIDRFHATELRRWMQLADAHDQFEKFYNNHVAIVSVSSSDYVKKTKKRMRKGLKSAAVEAGPELENECTDDGLITDVCTYFNKIANIEYNIYHKLFTCFKNYYVSRSFDFKSAMEDYNKHSVDICKLIESTTISDNELSLMNMNPDKFRMKPPKVIRSVSTFRKTMSRGSIKQVTNSTAKLYVAFSAFKAKSEGCIDLNPGDTLNTISEEVNGWVYGTNFTTKRVGWFPSSFIKRPEDIQQDFLSTVMSTQRVNDQDSNTLL